MKTSILNFGGFYESTHSDNIDNMCYYYEDNDDNIEFENYKDLHIEYSKKYVDFINELTGCKLKFIELISPKYYNYSTDKIEISYCKKDFLAIKKYIKENDLIKEVEKHIKNITTSKSGYVALYEYDEIFIPDNKSLLLQCYLDVIINQSETDWNDFYDRNNVYEIIYSL